MLIFGLGKPDRFLRLANIGREDGEVSIFEGNGRLAPDHDGGSIAVTAIRRRRFRVVTPELLAGGVGNAMQAVGRSVSPMLTKPTAASHDESIPRFSRTPNIHEGRRALDDITHAGGPNDLPITGADLFDVVTESSLNEV